MTSKRWGALTPETVSKLVTFDREQSDWKYRKSDHSMPARQAEGVAGLWNKLALYDVALLADEVGTGKTLQALSVMAMLWRQKPDAKVLVMAPNRDICRHWVRQFEIFAKTHYRQADGVVRRHEDAEPAHQPELCWSLEDLATDVETKEAKFFITTIYSLSSLVRGEYDEKEDKLGKAADVAASVHRRIKRALVGDGFDLVVVDEAHYFRNSEGLSQRAKAARKFFGRLGDRLGEKALLMTATPCHSSMDDVPALLGYFTEVSGFAPEDLLRKYALRRLRRMEGKMKSHDKYSYRNEREVKVDFSGNPEGEVFFALYQKLLARKQSKEKRRFMYGYLEGFESFEVKPDSKVSAKDDDGRRNDFNEAGDTQILKKLSRMHAGLGGAPAHPKYDEVVDLCVPKDIFDSRQDLHERKHLIFVRRVPSVRELARRVNAAYDRQLAQRIIRALKPPDPKDMLKRWEEEEWSREFFSRHLDPVRHDVDTEDGDEPERTEHPPDGPAGSDEHVLSKIALLFVVKSDGVQRTHCSNFSQRLRRHESIFYLLLEPASDYRAGRYHYYDRKQKGDKWRDTYAAAATRARSASHPSDDVLDERKFRRPMPTLWSKMHDFLAPADQRRLRALAKNPTRAESFGSYVREGFLFASPVLVELYSWYVEFLDLKIKGDAQATYLAFLAFIQKRLAKSMALAYFRAGLETFNALCENVPSGKDGIKWSMLTGLTSPAFYASSAVTDRQRLILGFNSPFYPNVLASTSVLQEGVNLHLQCRKVHHYGIAWTPGDNEQRVGRVDRLFGKVNAQLRRDDKSELLIHYPYLAGSIDEEQLAAFIRDKHKVEEEMDACRQLNVSSEIDLSVPSANWREYLRQPRSAADKPAPDPFQYNEAERPPKDYLV